VSETPQPNDPAPEEAQPVSLSEEPTVDLAEEAGRAAATQADPKEQKLRSLDELDVDGAVRAQIEELLAGKDADHRRREEAKETFLNVLGSEGLHPGSEGYQKVQATYSEAVQQGKLTSDILLSEAGIRTLVAMAGVSKSYLAPAAPQSGLTRSAPSPDGSVSFADGTIQLNAGRADDATLEDRMRRAIEKSLDS
jgi:hypothetical protein